jgi:pimeloyl-ACP methyl ester carboxylesterase
MASRIRLRLLCIALGALFINGCADSDRDHPPNPVTYRTVDCPKGQTLPANVSLTCGALTVPESRDEATTKTTTKSARMIELAVFRLSLKNSAAKEPMLYLDGGPGDAASASIDSWAESSILATRDIILLDQRGTGLSTPVLSCPERQSEIVTHFTKPQAVSAELAAARAAVDRCVARATAAGIDLRAYNSIETALDVRDLRRALNIERWHIMGASYGTRASLAVMRYASEGVVSFVLDSVSPPDESASARRAALDAERAFERLFETCAADASCTAANGDLRKQFSRMEERFNAVPWTLNVPLRPSQQSVAYTMRGGDFAFMVFRFMYNPDLLPELPNLISALANGQTELVEETVKSFLQGLPASGDYDAALTYLAVECNDLRRLFTTADKAFDSNPGRLPLSVLISASPYCSQLPGEGNPVDYNRPVTSSVPTLLLAGEFDPVTLPEGTRKTGATLSRSIGILVQGGGHTPADNTDCGKTIVEAFLAAPERPNLPTCAIPLSR